MLKLIHLWAYEKYRKYIMKTIGMAKVTLDGLYENKKEIGIRL
jgi:hypothetical protein